MTQPVSKVPTVSQNPAANSKQPEKTNPDMQKLAATLKSAGVIKTEPEINDFVSAYSAKQANPNQQLPDNQAAMMANLAGAQLKDKTLDTKLDLQMKTMSQRKPMGQTPLA
jgi:hypothetical protein